MVFEKTHYPSLWLLLINIEQFIQDHPVFECIRIPQELRTIEILAREPLPGMYPVPLKVSFTDWLHLVVCTIVIHVTSFTF